MNILKKIALVTAMSAAACTILTGCPDKNLEKHMVDDEISFDDTSYSDDITEEDLQSIKVQFDISIGGESAGSFVVTTDPENAPITCKNFKKLVEEGFYDGLSFHRVVDGFMAQGGAPSSDGMGGASENIYGEFVMNGWDNNHSHTRGTISMARPKDLNGASSQFFICYTDDFAPVLDGQYAAFGDVTEGMEVVDSFLNVERTLNDINEMAVPTVPIIIEKASVIG